MITRKRLGVLLAVLALLTAGNLWWIFATREPDKVITAYFGRAVGVYVGSDVQVLGVKVGSVRSVTPQGNQVEVMLSVEPDAPVSADSKAVVVAPSLVADRYVQLTNSTRGGPRIADGTVIPAQHTATPVELDELYASLNDLLTALGPSGANAEGALSELLDTGASNLRGNGEAFNENVRNFAELAKTLAAYKDDLFGTVDELQRFAAMLSGNDRQVATVNEQLAQVSQTLAADRDELAGALHTLGAALGEIQAFIRENRVAIKSNVDKLAETTRQLVEHRASLAEALDVAPLAVTNVLNAFDPGSNTLQGRSVLLEYLPLPVAGQVYLGGQR